MNPDMAQALRDAGVDLSAIPQVERLRIFNAMHEVYAQGYAAGYAKGAGVDE